MAIGAGPMWPLAHLMSGDRDGRIRTATNGSEGRWSPSTFYSVDRRFESGRPHYPRLCAAIVDRLTYHGTIIETGTTRSRPEPMSETVARRATKLSCGNRCSERHSAQKDAESRAAIV